MSDVAGTSKEKFNLRRFRDAVVLTLDAPCEAQEALDGHIVEAADEIERLQQECGNWKQLHDADEACIGDLQRQLREAKERRATHEPCEGDQGLPAEVYEEAMEDFVRMQHDIARLLGVDAETDSDDLHERIYTELSRRAAQPPDPALDRVQDIIEGMHCECDVSVGLTCHPCRAIKVIAEARRASPTKGCDAG